MISLKLDSGTPSERRVYALEEQQRYINEMRSLGIEIKSRNDSEYARVVHELLNAIAPMNARGVNKERIGGEGDGGYVMLENQHETEKNLILQMDIEGAEWDVFDELTEDDLLRFSQIIVELHGAQPPRLYKYALLNKIRRKLTSIYSKYALLNKIRRTHTPVHVHYNNIATPLLSLKNDLFVADIIEISYARTQDYIFEPCADYFPTPLDRPNVAHRPEIPIGYFNLAE